MTREIRLFWMFVLVLGIQSEVEADSGGSLDSLLEVWHDESANIDERFAAFDEMYAGYHQRYPDTMLVELEQLAVKALEHNRPLILFEAWVRKGGLLNYKGLNEQALKAYQRAEEVILPFDDDMRMGSLASNRGNVYANQADYARAMDSFTTALELYTAANFAPGQRNARMALGNVFVLIEMFELGKTQYEEVLAELDWTPENARFRGLLYTNLGYCEYKLGNLQHARELYYQAMPLAEQAHSDYHLACIHQNIGTLYEEEGLLDDAEFHAMRSLTLFERLGAEQSMVECQVLLARLHLGDDVRGSLEQAEGILARQSDIKDHKLSRDLHELLYLAHKELGNTPQALEMHESYLAFHDSVEHARNKYIVIRTAYEKDVEHRLNVLRMEGQEEVDRLYIKQLQTVILLIVIFGLVVAGVVAYALRNKAMHEQRKASLLKEIEGLKASQMRNMAISMPSLEDQRAAIEAAIDRPLNETDWKVLNLLMTEPTMTNQAIADQAFLSIDGIGSSLRRMYEYFNIKETRYKKIALVHVVTKLTLEPNHPSE
ncbi:MAG: tetratricopeptide repeat protein [Bacteroidetes bacterium]|nr:tetratricopeptide repeat protein [Bacteroidota bacterium]MDA1336499.1 tetratricopeptide repeat protein [Bacteroidota bacterium]